MPDYGVSTGYLPGLTGRIAGFHGEYYIKHRGFNSFFEARIASDLAEFINRYGETCDRTWSLTINDVIEGSITIDSMTESPGVAHLRWFFLSDNLCGKGAGNELMRQSMEFSRQKGFGRVYLDTLRGLDTARYLYEKHGFTLVDESTGGQWVLLSRNNGSKQPLKKHFRRIHEIRGPKF
jgi:GNAT superfamily N-acetyltransferase